MSSKRTDIQALRGLAIGLVVLHHAQIPFLKAGFLGVDIFFVISGYLITGLIKADIERGEFSFIEFYTRRAKRLLPAAYTTFLACALLAPFVLSGPELNDFAMQLVGAVTFTSNIVLWQQTGYFEGASELKPLLHVWSLAIEEQYYLLLPAAMVVIPPRHWLACASAVLVLTFVLTIVGGHFKPVATFYLLPTRGWELAIGSVGAVIGASRFFDLAARLLFLPALTALVLIPVLPIGGNHPGWDALLVCLATLIVIRRAHQGIEATFLVRTLAGLGDFSYSLYLVHWPIFAFLNNAWVGGRPGEIPAEIRGVAVVLSVILGYALYRYIERPIHRAAIAFSWRALFTSAGATIALIALAPGLISSAAGGITGSDRLEPNYGFSQACEFGDRFEPKPECRNSEMPGILVWGDSYAMHLVPGIVATSGSIGVVQATRSRCGPLLDLAPIGKPGAPQNVLTKQWAEDCLHFNDSVVRYLASAPSIETVVLSSPFVQYLESSGHLNLRRRGSDLAVIEPSETEALAALERSVGTVRALGKQVVVVAPPPAIGFDIGACRERLAHGMISIGAPAGCNIPVASYWREKEALLRFLRNASSKAGVPVFTFDTLLCDEKMCATAIGTTSLYRDGGHLSEQGSRVLGKRANLAQSLRALAR